MAKPKLTVTVLLYSRIPSGDKHFLAQATPENKMALIKHEQEGGKLVAMTGDGANDASALAWIRQQHETHEADSPTRYDRGSQQWMPRNFS